MVNDAKGKMKDAITPTPTQAPTSLIRIPLFLFHQDQGRRCSSFVVFTDYTSHFSPPHTVLHTDISVASSLLCFRWVEYLGTVPSKRLTKQHGVRLVHKFPSHHFCRK